MIDVNERRAVQFQGLKQDPSFQEFCAWMKESLEQIRVDSDTLVEERDMRISQGKRQTLVEIFDALNDTDAIVNALKG